jgi:transposase
LESDLTVSTTLHPGNAADAATVIDTAIDAAVNLEKACCENAVELIVADKVYYSAQVVMQAAAFGGTKTCIPECATQTQRR